MAILAKIKNLLRRKEKDFGEFIKENWSPRLKTLKREDLIVKHFFDNKDVKDNLG